MKWLHNHLINNKKKSYLPLYCITFHLSLCSLVYIILTSSRKQNITATGNFYCLTKKTTTTKKQQQQKKKKSKQKQQQQQQQQKKKKKKKKTTTKKKKQQQQKKKQTKKKKKKKNFKLYYLSYVMTDFVKICARMHVFLSEIVEDIHCIPWTFPVKYGIPGKGHNH